MVCVCVCVAVCVCVCVHVRGRERDRDRESFGDCSAEHLCVPVTGTVRTRAAHTPLTGHGAYMPRQTYSTSWNLHQCQVASVGNVKSKGMKRSV